MKVEDALINIIVKNRELVLSVFPEAEEAFSRLDKAEGEPGCTSCKKRSYARNLLNKVISLSGDGRDLSAFNSKETAVLNTVLKAGNAQKPVSDYDRDILENRLACPDCVCKHLSQAFVLLKESVQGYREHVALASGRLERAAKFVSKQNIRMRNRLMEIKKELDESLSGAEDNATALHINRAASLIEDILAGNESHPLAVWKVIGHLGEAADECVEADPALAAEIRMERLLLMEDPEQRPNLMHLLSRARKINSDRPVSEN